MEWVADLSWVDVPVAEDGGEAPMASRSPLRAYVGWDLQAGNRATPVSVLLRRTDGEAVTPAEWRRLKSSEIIGATRDLLRAAGLWAQFDPDTRDAGEALMHTLDGEALATPVGRARYSEDHYRRVADVYNAAVNSGDTQPVQAVRRVLRSEFSGLTDTTVRGWIQAAKRRGLITKTVRPSRAKNTKGGQQ